MEKDKKWSVLVLAAGYGTRLAKDIKSEVDSPFSCLLNLPKALLPIAGVPLIDYWYRDLLNCPSVNMENFFIVTNNVFHSQFIHWGICRGISDCNIINDGTTSNETRLGAVGDIALCLANCSDKLKDSKGLIIVAGDTLFYDDFNVSTFLEEISSNMNTSGIVYYTIKEESETLKRGIIEVDSTDSRAIKLLEKPHPSATPSRKACPAFYAYHASLYDTIVKYYNSSLSLPIEERDAPGKLLCYLINEQEVLLSNPSQHANASIIKALEIQGRFDIGNLAEYKYTLDYFTNKLQNEIMVKNLPKTVSDTCYARVGLMGNPSDGFKGKTLSFLIKNFSAKVFVNENIRSNAKSSEGNYLSIHSFPEIQIVPHPEYDPTSYSNLQSLQLHSETKGYYGGVRLLQATCTVFSSLCFKNGIFIHLQRGFRMSYETTIPRMVGLSGSSAIVVAAFRSLLAFYGLTLDDLKISKTDFPQIILDIERLELEISAGLQDRVIQTYGGLVFMDFTLKCPSYHPLDPSLLPPLYLAYNTSAGGESGKVHSTVKDRWLRQEPELLEGMAAIGLYAAQAVDALKSGDYRRLAELMDCNFAMRRKLYSDAVVGERNVAVAILLKGLGLACKFTGSGGAFLCLRNDGIREWLPEDSEQEIVCALRSKGFEFVRIELP